MEKTKTRAGEERNQPQKKFLTIEFQCKCTAYDPGIEESVSQYGEGIVSEARIGMQKEQYLAGSMPRSNIHLDRTSPLLTVDYPSVWPCYIGCSVTTASIDNDGVKLSFLPPNTLQ
jgi:hypothetical protein